MRYAAGWPIPSPCVPFDDNSGDPRDKLVEVMQPQQIKGEGRELPRSKPHGYGNGQKDDKIS